MEAKWEDVISSLNLATLSLELADSYSSDAVVELNNTINMLDRALSVLSTFRRKCDVNTTGRKGVVVSNSIM